MGFWIIVFIVVCVVSAFYERFGKRDPHIKERSKQPPQLQRPTPVVQPRTSARSAGNFTADAYSLYERFAGDFARFN